MTHNIEEDGTMSSRTVSSSDYHAKCAGCVAKERTIATLEATIAELRVAAGAVCGFPSPKAWERLEEVLEKCSPTTK